MKLMRKTATNRYTSVAVDCDLYTRFKRICLDSNLKTKAQVEEILERWIVKMEKTLKLTAPPKN